MSKVTTKVTNKDIVSAMKLIANPATTTQARSGKIRSIQGWVKKGLCEFQDFKLAFASMSATEERYCGAALAMIQKKLAA